MRHPNTTAATVAGGIGILITWLLGYFGIDVSAELGGTIATAIAAVVLFVGRRGIRGVLATVWNGSEKQPVRVRTPNHRRRHP